LLRRYLGFVPMFSLYFCNRNYPRWKRCFEVPFVAFKTRGQFNNPRRPVHGLRQMRLIWIQFTRWPSLIADGSLDPPLAVVGGRRWMFKLTSELSFRLLNVWMNFLFPGPMLWSQISAIFANFRRENWRFLKNQCCDQIFALFSSVLGQKRQFFRRIFRRKYLNKHNIGPRSVQHFFSSS
jgi:hypothetical protein